EEEASALESRHLEMTRLATSFQTEAFIEREGRLKLGLKMPGEEVIVITDGQAPPAAAGGEAAAGDPASALAASAAEAAAPPGNPRKWWIYFFDRSRFDSLTSTL